MLVLYPIKSTQISIRSHWGDRWEGPSRAARRSSLPKSLFDRTTKRPRQRVGVGLDPIKSTQISIRSYGERRALLNPAPHRSSLPKSLSDRASGQTSDRLDRSSRRPRSSLPRSLSDRTGPATIQRPAQPAAPIKATQIFIQSHRTCLSVTTAAPTDQVYSISI